MRTCRSEKPLVGRLPELRRAPRPAPMLKNSLRQPLVGSQSLDGIRVNGSPSGQHACEKGNQGEDSGHGQEGYRIVMARFIEQSR